VAVQVHGEAALPAGSTALPAFCCLTFELRGRRRCGALAARPMIYSTAARPGCHAGGGPLERRVRRLCPGLKDHGSARRVEQVPVRIRSARKTRRWQRHGPSGRCLHNLAVGAALRRRACICGAVQGNEFPYANLHP
jgi:hypothetical protein